MSNDKATVFNETWEPPKPKMWVFECDPRYWAILPALTLNLHSIDDERIGLAVEFEFLCFGIYFNMM